MKQFMIGVISLALVCSGCNRPKDTPVMAATVAAPAPAAKAPVAASKTGFIASGPLVVENEVDVQALREGVVVSILAQPGTPVHRGQLLATLDDRQISADIDAAAAKARSVAANIENWRAETKVLQADRNRAEKLYEAQILPKEQLDHAQYQEEADEYEIKRETESLANARDIEKSLELEREKTRVSAPFDGIVARRYVRVGQKVAVGDRLFWVTALAPLEVKFTLPEHYVSNIRVGDPLTVTSADIAQSKVSAKVMQVSPVVDPSSGTIEVLAQVVGPAPELRPGMLVNISPQDAQ